MSQSQILRADEAHQQQCSQPEHSTEGVGCILWSLSDPTGRAQSLMVSNVLLTMYGITRHCNIIGGVNKSGLGKQ